MSESIGFFSERHSSEFLARMTAGAKSITDLLNMLINAIGRDFLVLVAMIAVMVAGSDPVADRSRCRAAGDADAAQTG